MSTGQVNKARSEEKEIKMNYLVENIYTEETKAFLTECQAYNYMYEEIEKTINLLWNDKRLSFSTKNNLRRKMIKILKQNKEV